MSSIKIKSIVFYIFLILVFGLILSSGVLYVSLKQLDFLNKKVVLLGDVKNSFLEVKIKTERLLTTSDFTTSSKEWDQAIEDFDKKLLLLGEKEQKVFEDFWYISKKEIQQIKKILDKNTITPQSLQKRSISMIKGEMFALNEKTDYYREILSLIHKIEYLLEYEEFIFTDLSKMQSIEKANIDEQISDLIDHTILFVLVIAILMLTIVFVLNKKILKIENKLIYSKKALSESLVKLKDAKLLLQNIIDTVPISIFWKDTHGKYLGLNKTFLEESVQMESIHQVIGKTDDDMPWTTSEAKRFKQDDQEVLNNNKSKLRIEESLTKSNGEKIEIISSKVPLRDIKGETIGILGVSMDITETKEMYEELTFKDRLLSQQSKMAAMGEMLENIAHQWRQPLSLISSSASGLKVKREFEMLDDEYFFLAINHITESTVFLDQTIEDFRNYFKEDKEFKHFKIQDQIEKALFLASSKLKNRSIEIIKDMDKEEAYGLENEFIQVVMNIVNNAVDILSEKEISDKTIKIDAKEKDEYIEISIHDNAGGIPEDIIDKVFNPYFTTKGDKNGTGIGLHMSKDIIEKHMHGKISVVNEEFQLEDKSHYGAKFIILLKKNQEDK